MSGLDTKGHDMTDDELQAMWWGDEPHDDRPMGSCILLTIVLVAVWAVIALGVWAVIAR